MPIFKNWKLICTICKEEKAYLCWQTDIPKRCRCGGQFSDSEASPDVPIYIDKKQQMLDDLKELEALCEKQ